ncbi:glycosyltransferase family 4 protein [Deminuibacter soli]|uniref:Glycosyltransferase family 4 protein n=1 Tax=Deminuibacter soli TaxID=2291815 RepID=A0A3E1NK49_9BACT|nr:glycosyltransferase family 4 protein [Deminuibacter soli]RFM28251.1 glycosyltransferase family 4 protein [Deminuibacter soli]
MKIAQIAPLYEAVPPRLYGGTERVIHYLTEELVKQGHEVTLFASGDSITAARLVATVPEALRLNPHCIDPMAHHILQMQQVINRSHEFDILHFHTDFLHFPFSAQCAQPCITTLHGRLDIPDLQPLYNHFRKQKVVSISASQRKPLPQANWISTVYHGLPRHLHRLHATPGNYFAFIGRISPEKRADRAIEIAIACNTPIKIAAKIDKTDESYFREHIAHLFDHPLVEYIGEINETQKTAFLGNAKALLFPIDWSEPFGMVLIEAMSCGTPVIAFNRGSVPEIIDDGVTGFIVNNVSEAVAALQRLPMLNRSVIRTVFEQKFTAERMARDYVQVYHQLTSNAQRSNPRMLPASLTANTLYPGKVG